MKKFLYVLCLTFLPGIATAHPREMILAGGAMKLCSSLSASACKGSDSFLSNARKTARYKMTSDSMSLALSPAFWSSRKQAPSADEMMQMIEPPARKYTGKIVSADELADIFSTACTVNGKSGKCSTPGARKTWDSLLDDERSYVISAFELPERDGDQRRREVANIDDSKNSHGVTILRAFVKAAAERSPGKRPLVLFVTAAGADPYDAVDFYLSAFKQAGADPVWWPIDSALEASLADPEKCNALAKHRVVQLGLANREIVYPDLAEIQKVACENAVSLAQFPSQAQGIFFGGGDQWRLRQIFFDEQEQPNIWLKNLRTAFNTGSLVIGGTSAGTAVQSGRAMLTGGTSDAALTRGIKNAAPVASGCELSRRCADSLTEDDLTYWPAGGLALVEGFAMDTHFSERARPIRLLKLLADTHAGVGLGVDETSALHLTWQEQQVDVEALGAAGAWWFELPQSKNNIVTARVHYLAPGHRFVFKDGALVREASRGLISEFAKVPAGFPDSNALNDNILRDAMHRLAHDDVATISLQAADHKIKLSKTAETTTWRGGDGQIGISGVEMELSIDKK